VLDEAPYDWLSGFNVKKAFTGARDLLVIADENYVTSILDPAVFDSELPTFGPPRLITCKKLKKLLNVKECQCNCGVITPLELLNKKDDFKPEPKPDKAYTIDELSFAVAEDPSIALPERFSSMCMRLSSRLSISQPLAAVLLASTAISQIQHKISLQNRIKRIKNTIIRFFPLFICDSNEIHYEYTSAFKFIFKSMREYQEQQWAEKNSELKKNCRKIAYLRKRLANPASASEQKKLEADIKNILSMELPARLFMDARTPKKILQTLHKHPECCCSYDTDESISLFQTILSNTRQQHDVIRFLSQTQYAAEAFQYEDEYGHRTKIQHRHFVSVLAMDRKNYAKLFARHNRHFKNLTNFIFPIDAELGMAFTNPKPTEETIENILAGLVKKARQASEIIIDLQRCQALSAKDGAELTLDEVSLAAMLGVAIELFETDNVSFTDTGFKYGLQLFCFLRWYKGYLIHTLSLSPEILNAKRIAKHIIKREITYFRLSQLQKMMRMPISEIQSGVDVLIQHGWAAKVYPEYKVPNLTHIGQLYLFNKNKSINGPEDYRWRTQTNYQAADLSSSR
jgi:hypothetical protein